MLAVSALWEKRKGLHDVIYIAESMDSNSQMVVIGVDEKQKKQLPANIISIRRTNSVEELKEWYAIADVYINPTYEDNYPTTNLEALSCGTPVITYDTGGSGEMLDGRNGLHVQKDFRYMNNAMDQVLCIENVYKLWHMNQTDMEGKAAVKKYQFIYQR